MTDSNPLVSEQVAPTPTKGDCWLLVLKDMEDRRTHGIEKYGVPVQPFNGRDPLVDAYQEALDLVVYLRQEVEQRAEYKALVDKVLAFKDYVHGRLDMMGIPVDPPSVSRDQGCRIGGRLDVLLGELEALRAFKDTATRATVADGGVW